MFGFRPRKADVIRHWYSLIPDFNASTKEFYDAVERELTERKVPALDIARVEFSEGGVLSAKREYLRLTRERLVFDICAAPFGTSFFFSCRFAEIPATIKLLSLLLLFVAFVICVPLSFNICIRLFGILTPLIWPLGWLVVLVLGIYTLRNAVAMGLRDLDAALVKSPLFGGIYERFFRKETYYREDTRLMYCDLVNEVVKTNVEEVTAAKGIKLIRFNDYNPVLGDLYRPTLVELPRSQPTP